MKYKPCAITLEPGPAFMSPCWQWIAAIVFPIVILLPFVNKPIHIDDTAYIAIAKHITQNPMDYYGFSMNWNGTSLPVYQWHRSPPLASYFLAALGACLGWEEWKLHLGFLLPASLCGAATLMLSRRLCKRPEVALFATLCSPAFVVTGTGLMLDTWLLAFFLLALACLLEGFARNQLRWLLLAGLCAGLASWTKYFGASLPSLFLVYALLRRDRPKGWWLCLLIPLVMIGLEQTTSYVLYGQLLVKTSAQSIAEERNVRPLWLWALVGLSFCGGSTFPVMQIGAVLWRTRLRVAGTVLVAAFAFLLYVLDAHGIRRQTLGLDLPLVSLIVYAIFIFGGSQLFSLAITDIRNRRQPESWLLALWICGTFAFAGFVSWSVNVRSVLPLVPAAAILAARRLDTMTHARPGKVARKIVVSLIVSTVVSLAVARADARWAWSVRNAAEHFENVLRPAHGNVYFEGHWGFQYYMTRAGFRPFDSRATQLQPGDLVICPQNNSNVKPLPSDFVAERHRYVAPIGGRMATMSVPLGAGFYSDLWGPLPFALGLKMPPDNYFIYTVAKAGNPGQRLE